MDSKLVSFMSEKVLPSHFQHLLKPCQIPRAVVRDERHVFEPHAAEFGIIKSRLDRHDLTGLEFAGGSRTHARGFVNFQTQTVTRAVKKSLHAAIALAGLVTLLLEKFQHGLVDVIRPRARANFFEPDLLPAKDGVVKPSHAIARAPAHHRARDVAKVTGFLRTRKNINDDWLVRAQRAVAAFVRIAALFAARDD